ncbi:uncharacterized protein YsxB (DUF464 family) [Bacilli bacterium PM5-3]|nr:uncharacterized protein YsxB (DUF464 family) [Bacilli bacterium PM5-3]MDH6603103.1 uncharacterized protein YsxB (DUF464 family) [Bacilli bacterium PM5-9]
MTKVKIEQHNDYINSIEIKGHAMFAENGKDIVCAAISSIVFGTLNALIEFNLTEDNIIVSEAYIKIDMINDDKLQMIVKTMIIQLQTIQESYPDYIQILIN